jgi:iron-sulfur cluster assembly protein
MITLTELAAKKALVQITKREHSIGIRIGVKTTGCSGLAYTLEYVDVQDSADEVFENFGVKVFVDPKSLVYINGMDVDWTRNGLNEGFNFINNKERDRCGCGISFRI